MALRIADAREEIGRVWGLDRPITKAELARALKLSPENGGDYVSRLEKSGRLTGPVEALIEAFLDGYSPRHMCDVIKPGYPRTIGLVDMIGEKSGPWTVVAREENGAGGARWRARCTCGVEQVRYGTSLRREREDRCPHGAAEK